MNQIIFDNISNWDVQNVTNMSDSFLTEFNQDISAWNVVTNMGNVFKM